MRNQNLPLASQINIALAVGMLEMVLSMGTAFASEKVCEGNYVIKNWVDLHEISGCTEITGNLVIVASNLTDLDELSSLTSIGLNLNIVANPFLQKVDGLRNLTSIGLNLNVISNPVLQDLYGLRHASVGLDINIRDNPMLR